MKLLCRTILASYVAAAFLAACGDSAENPPPPPPPQTPGSKNDVSGKVYKPLAALSMMSAQYDANAPYLTAPVMGAVVCVDGAMPESCSAPSGADGSYTVGVPVEISKARLRIKPMAAEFLETIAGQEIQLVERIDGSLEEPEVEFLTIGSATDHNLGVVETGGALAAAAVAAGLATAGDAMAAQKAIEKGVALIWSDDLTVPMTSNRKKELPKNIDVDATAGRLFALSWDAGAATAQVTDIETGGANATYPLPLAVLIGTGADTPVVVTLTDPAAAQTLKWSSAHFTLKANEVYFARPFITNEASRFH